MNLSGCVANATRFTAGESTALVNDFLGTAVAGAHHAGIGGFIFGNDQQRVFRYTLADKLGFNLCDN